MGVRQPAQPSVFNLWGIGWREIVEMSRCNDNSDVRTPVSDSHNEERIVPYSAPKGAATAEPLEGELVDRPVAGTPVDDRGNLLDDLGRLRTYLY